MSKIEQRPISVILKCPKRKQKDPCSRQNGALKNPLQAAKTKGHSTPTSSQKPIVKAMSLKVNSDVITISKEMACVLNE